MRLLKCDDTGGVSFTKDLSKSELAEPKYKYAILSHRWGADEEEVTYEDISNGIGTTKAGVGSQKIRFCMRQARQDGLDHFWIDTCCIDKSKEVELGTALRSMFRWYASSAKCYVFLSDVPQKAEQDKELAANWEHDFRFSTWFKRGWTLQELIAPSMLEFYTRDGVSLGTKSSLERHINEITRIPIRALRGYAFSDFTIHERWQWQEGRETREPEDIVYSLLGLLDVSMPIMYGEGRDKALRRLENDTSIGQKGIPGLRHDDFSLVFSLAEAAIEVERFVARQSELQDIRDQLSSDGSRRTVVLHGLGGIGKTQLAMAYAKRHRNDYSALLWLNARDKNSLTSGFIKMAKQILREHPSAPTLASLNVDQDPDVLINAVKAWLSMPMNTRWLLLCDNYDNPRVVGDTDPTTLRLQDYLPEAYQGSVLITTRSSEAGIGHCIRLQKLDKWQDSLEILEHSSGRSNLTDDTGAIELVKRLDGLPLALSTAGAYLSQSAMTCAKYLEFFNQSWATLHRRGRVVPTYQDRTLYSTWQISYDQIKRKNKTSAKLLHLWAFFDNQDLWFELLNHVNDKSPSWMSDLVEDRLAFEDCIQVLCDHGLAEANPKNVYAVESTGYSVHACVHSWMSTVLNSTQDEPLAYAAMRCVASHALIKDELKWHLIHRRLLNHADRSMVCINDDDTKTGLDWAYHSLAGLYMGQDKPIEAEELFMRALREQQKALGPEHASTLDTMSELGRLYIMQNKLPEAEEIYTRALKRKEKALGPDHMSTLGTVHSLGIVYEKQKKPAESEEMYTRALRGQEKVLGPNHASTLKTVHSLGGLYENQKKPAESEEMYTRALRGFTIALGPVHTSTLLALRSLANVCYTEGRLVQAERIYMQVLELTETAKCSNRMMIHAILISLGAVYTAQNRPVEAEEMIIRALRGTEEMFGPNHAFTNQIVVSLGLFYIRQKRFEEAEEQYCRARIGYSRMTPVAQGNLDILGSLLPPTIEGRAKSDAMAGTTGRG